MSRSAQLRLAACGMHPDRVRALLDRWGGPAAVLGAIERGSIEVSERVRDAAAVDAAARWAWLRERDVSVVTPDGADYPERLAGLPGRPELLFVSGRIPAGPAVAVVGTRRATRYGRDLATAYGRAIAAAGWVLVSGLARGIDGAAHRGTVAGGGAGVAVLGCGIDVVYPAEHAGLQRSLLAAGGAVVSEYPPGTPPEGWRFPPRNRVISGMADAVVVVEAGETGGALITAGLALDQGRPVFAVPGDVHRASSRGTNRLIRDGAHPVLDPADLIEELSLVLGPPVPAPASNPEEFPAGGVRVDELVAGSERPAAEVLAWLGALEATGAVARVGDVVYPAKTATLGGAPESVPVVDAGAGPHNHGRG